MIGSEWRKKCDMKPSSQHKLAHQPTWLWIFSFVTTCSICSKTWKTYLLFKYLQFLEDHCQTYQFCLWRTNMVLYVHYSLLTLLQCHVLHFINAKGKRKQTTILVYYTCYWYIYIKQWRSLLNVSAIKFCCKGSTKKLDSLKWCLLSVLQPCSFSTRRCKSCCRCFLKTSSQTSVPRR